MVPVRDIQPGNYFYVRGKQLYQVEEAHMEKRVAIAAAVNPIPISTVELRMFGFNNVNPGSVEFEIFYTGSSFSIKPATLDRWALIIAGRKYRFVQYMHELQMVYFVLFSDDLVRGGKRKNK